MAKAITAIIIVGLAMGVRFAGLSHAQDTPLETVRDFNIQRYLGVWHEVAAIPARFQRHCVGETRAAYALGKKNRVLVVNSCRTANGERDIARGTARFTSAPERGQLEVSFLHLFGRPLWFAGGAYWVVALGPDYSWSVVGHPERKYAWVLARQPVLPQAVLSQIEIILGAQGYDTCALIVTSDGQAEGRPRLCDVASAMSD